MKNLVLICALIAAQAQSANDEFIQCTVDMYLLVQKKDKICNIEKEMMAGVLFLSQGFQPADLPEELRQNDRGYIDFREEVRKEATSVYNYCTDLRTKRDICFAPFVWMVIAMFLEIDQIYAIRDSSVAVCRYDDCHSVKGVLDDICQYCENILALYQQQQTHIEYLRSFIVCSPQSAAAPTNLAKRDATDDFKNLDICQLFCDEEAKKMQDFLTKFRKFSESAENFSDVEAMVWQTKIEKERFFALASAENQRWQCIIL
ncbi:MAG: hypothetical protein OXC30_01120 [Alphaproteobacteria bacterium]|nr:hypothetical protein [Alphaproteobacteria bacterium]